MDHRCYLDLAEQLLVHAQSAKHDQLVSSIELAIAALELYLNSPALIPSLEYELRARLLLCRTLQCYTTNTRRAEDICSAALVKIHNQDTYISYRLAFNEVLSHILQSTGTVNAAKRIVKDSIALCVDRGRNLDLWHFTFLLHAVDIDKSMAALRALRQFGQDRANTQVARFVNILEYIFVLSHGLDIPAHLVNLSLAEATATAELSMEDYMLLGLSVLADVIAGRVSSLESDINVQQQRQSTMQALDKLLIIHKGLDAKPKLDPVMTIYISTTDDGTTQSIKLRAMNTRRFMILIYVLSALVHLAEMTSSRCEKFLAVGEDLLKQEKRESAFLGQDDWLMDMQDTIHIFKAFNFLLHSEADLVLGELSQVPRHSVLQTFLLGCYAQQTGQLDAALQHYSRIDEHELRTLALLNTLLIYSGHAKRDEQKVKNLLLELENLCTNGPTLTALRLIKSITPYTTSVALKRALNTVLTAAKTHANSQINMLALTLLGTYSADPDDMRLRFFSHALGQANKSSSTSAGASHWSHFNGHQVEDILEDKANLRNTSSSEEHQKAVDKLQKVRSMNTIVDGKLKAGVPHVYETLVRS